MGVTSDAILRIGQFLVSFLSDVLFFFGILLPDVLLCDRTSSDLANVLN